MPSGLRRLLIALLLAAAVWQPVGAAVEHGCEQARLNYDQAVQQADAREALILLDDVIARCPSFNAWFGKGNAHRMLEQWDEALASYQQARGMAGEPQLSFMAQACGALMQHRLGRTCEAGRTFQYLGAGLMHHCRLECASRMKPLNAAWPRRRWMQRRWRAPCR